MASGDSDLMLDENVVAYRLGKVEDLLNDLRGEIQTALATTVNREILALHLKPLEDRVLALESASEQKAKDEASKDFQIRLAIITAFVAPILVAVIVYEVMRFVAV